MIESSALIEGFSNESQPAGEKRAASASPPDVIAAKKNFVTMSQSEDLFTPSKNLLRSPILAKRSVAPKPPGPPTSSSNDNITSKLSYNIITNNKFDALANSNNVNGDGTPHNAAVAGSSKVQRQPKVNIPPFVFTSATDFKSGLDIVYKHATDKHFIKYMRVGTKVQVDSMESYIAIDKEMSEAKLKYFTHDLMTERPAKFVINGLHQMPSNELETELKNNGLEPLNIQCVSVKKPRFDREHIYIIALPNSVTLSMVQQIKFVNRVKITWYKYVNKAKGPTQCRKCFLYGHGMRNCHLETVCVKCGISGHSGETCSAEEANIKCSNCGGNHIATDLDCKSRSSFIEMRKKRSAANNMRRNAVKSSNEFVRANDNVMFPALKTKPNRDGTLSSSVPPGGEWLFKNKTTFNPMRSRTVNDATATKDENLFSTSEILQITKNVLTGLASCKTKQQQLEVIFEICSTYLNGP